MSDDEAQDSPDTAAAMLAIPNLRAAVMWATVAVAQEVNKRPDGYWATDIGMRHHEALMSLLDLLPDEDSI